jgi:hypothetical protein
LEFPTNDQVDSSSGQ